MEVLNYNETDSEYQLETSLILHDQVEKVIDLLHRGCDTRNLTALIPAVSTLQLRCQHLGFETIALTLGQIGYAAQQENTKAIRWLLATLSQEYILVDAAMQGFRLRNLPRMTM